ncbi:hypothetical protein RRSWK_06626 [Rhodopirellula sp. SWK7]|nr:hypothetical protein RRSWK_06626 [Rhodopirellula sp. SWK7]
MSIIAEYGKFSRRTAAITESRRLILNCQKRRLRDFGSSLGSSAVWCSRFKLSNAIENSQWIIPSEFARSIEGSELAEPNEGRTLMAIVERSEGGVIFFVRMDEASKIEDESIVHQSIPHPVSKYSVHDRRRIESLAVGIHEKDGVVPSKQIVNRHTSPVDSLRIIGAGKFACVEAVICVECRLIERRAITERDANERVFNVPNEPISQTLLSVRRTCFLPVGPGQNK